MIHSIADQAATFLVNIRQSSNILLSRKIELNQRVRIGRMIENNGISPIAFNIGESDMICAMISVSIKTGKF